MQKELRVTVSGESADMFRSDIRLSELWGMILDKTAQFGNSETHEPYISGKWTIDNSYREDGIALGYENNTVIFVFSIAESADRIDFINSHRESAKRGKGSEALRQLEGSWELLAKNRGKRVVVKFYTDGQEDTQAWLEKFGYQEDPREVDGVYGPESWSKVIIPNSGDVKS